MTLGNIIGTAEVPSQVTELLATPLTGLEALADADTYSPHGAATQGQYVAVELMRRAAYMESRHAGRKHVEAVKFANHAVMKVRRAIGYSYPKNDVSF